MPLKAVVSGWGVPAQCESCVPTIRFHLEIGPRGLLIEWLAYPEFRRMLQFMELFRKNYPTPPHQSSTSASPWKGQICGIQQLYLGFSLLLFIVASFCLENQCLLPSWDQCSRQTTSHLGVKILAEQPDFESKRGKKVFAIAVAEGRGTDDNYLTFWGAVSKLISE